MALTERPDFGTAPIRCGRTRCKWRGFETLLADKKDGMFTRKLCPLCGCDSYMFMTPGEVKAWERSKTPNAEVSGCLRAPMREDAPRTAAGSPLDRPVGPLAGA